MRWVAGSVAVEQRFSFDRAYAHARTQAMAIHASQPGWWGLCSVLSRHQLQRGEIRPMAALWAELLPFLLVHPERAAERALASYLHYLDDPTVVDLQLLGLVVNESMLGVEQWNTDIARLLEEPRAVFDARWMALLSYASLIRLRRAVSMYGSDRALAVRRSCWHGMKWTTVHATAARRPGPAQAGSMSPESGLGSPSRRH